MKKRYLPYEYKPITWYSRLWLQAQEGHGLGFWLLLVFIVGLFMFSAYHAEAMTKAEQVREIEGTIKALTIRIAQLQTELARIQATPTHSIEIVRTVSRTATATPTTTPSQKGIIKLLKRFF